MGWAGRGRVLCSSEGRVRTKVLVVEALDEEAARLEHDEVAPTEAWMLRESVLSPKNETFGLEEGN